MLGRGLLVGGTIDIWGFWRVEAVVEMDLAEPFVFLEEGGGRGRGSIKNALVLGQLLVEVFAGILGFCGVLVQFEGTEQVGRVRANADLGPVLRFGVSRRLLVGGWGRKKCFGPLRNDIDRAFFVLFAPFVRIS